MARRRFRTRARGMLSRQQTLGLPPGSLVYTGHAGEKVPNMSLFRYNHDEVNEHPKADLDLLAMARNDGLKAWINIDGVHDTELVAKIGKLFRIHSLLLEDIVNTQQRPKVDIVGNHIFFTLKMLQWEPETETLSSEQVSFVLGKDYLISFQEREGDLFDPVRNRLRNATGKVRDRGSDYTMFALVDVVVDHYYFVMESIAEELNELEESIFNEPQASSLEEIHRIRQTLLNLRRSVYPLRECISQLEKLESPLLEEATDKYFRDLYDHVVQMIDSVEGFRDLSSSLKDSYMSTISFRMNQVMQVLTLVSTIFIPLTFLAGIYGMNFEHMPELGWEYSYPAFWGAIVVLGIGLYLYFRSKRWW